jgi:hypothetical protein
MLSIVRVGILETIASITCWEGPGVVRRMMMRKEIRERGKKERTNKRRTDKRRENFHAQQRPRQSRVNLTVVVFLAWHPPLRCSTNAAPPFLRRGKGLSE